MFGIETFDVLETSKVFSSISLGIKQGVEQTQTNNFQVGSIFCHGRTQTKKYPLIDLISGCQLASGGCAFYDSNSLLFLLHHYILTSKVLFLSRSDDPISPVRSTDKMSVSVRVCPWLNKKQLNNVPSFFDG